MTSVGHRPTLEEIIFILASIVNIEANVNATLLDEERFSVTLTFSRNSLRDAGVYEWSECEPKPTWLFEEIADHLRGAHRQRCREEQWVSKEGQFGASIDSLIAHWVQELKKVSSIVPETIATRLNKRVLASTVLRLKELQERRIAGAVSSPTEDRREKARKTWAEDEYEAPRREKEQTRPRPEWWDGSFWDEFTDSSAKDRAEELLRKYKDFISGRRYDQYRYQDNPKKPAPKQPPGKQPWYAVLGVEVSATRDQIVKAHRKLVAKHQPRTSAEAEDRERAEKMMEINVARDEGLAGL